MKIVLSKVRDGQWNVNDNREAEQAHCVVEVILLN
jgi:hypothetical protein